MEIGASSSFLVWAISEVLIKTINPISKTKEKKKKEEKKEGLLLLVLILVLGFSWLSLCLMDPWAPKQQTQGRNSWAGSSVRPSWV